MTNERGRHTYMMLGRLLSDAHSYFEWGGKLWGITPEAHADEMLKLWESLKIKPQWLTKVELEAISHRLKT